MALINKNVVSVFGHGIFGRAILSLNFDSQDIPSELYDGFRAVCGLARPTGKIEKRYPWSVNQPGTSDQAGVWDLFSKAIRCFARQPDAGGVTPPAIGPRNRSWWYAQSISSGLFYFDYFMKETLTLAHQGITPDWCKVLITADSYVSLAFPNTNYGGAQETELLVHKAGEFEDVARIWLKTPGEGSKKLYIYCQHLDVLGGLVRDIGVYEQAPGAWVENAITWNNQPVIGSLIMSFSSEDLSEGEWLEIDIGTADSVCIKFTDESIPGDGQTIDAIFTSKESDVPSQHPYLTID